MLKKQRMLKAAELRSRGLKQKEIAALLDVSERTVRTYLKNPPAVRKHTPRGSLLDPHKPYINSVIAAEPFYSCVRLYAELQTLGYAGHLTILREYVAAIRILALRREIDHVTAAGA